MLVMEDELLLQSQVTQACMQSLTVSQPDDLQLEAWQELVSEGRWIFDVSAMSEFASHNPLCLQALAGPSCPSRRTGLCRHMHCCPSYGRRAQRLSSHTCRLLPPAAAIP